MLNIVIPMAGRSSRFFDAGFSLPKPLLAVGEKTMIERVVENVRPSRPHRFIFICQRQHLLDYPALSDVLRVCCERSDIILIDEVTSGAAVTVLAARELIDTAEPLMIVNSDQLVDCDMDEYLGALERDGTDGLIMTFFSQDPKWSYCRVDSERRVTEVVEKEVVSDEATVGIYNFARGGDFVVAADQMVRQGLTVNGEFYVAPVYNLVIGRGGRVAIWNVGNEGAGMYGLGTPEDYCRYLDRSGLVRATKADSVDNAGDETRTSMALVAFRGMWDRFAGPNSLGAIQRAFSRGIAPLVWVDEIGLCLEKVVTAARESGVIARRMPLVLVGAPGQTSAGIGCFPELAGLPEVAQILFVALGPNDRLGVVFERRAEEWTVVGHYLTVELLAQADWDNLRTRLGADEILFLESRNTILDLDRQQAFGDLDDEQVISRVRSTMAAGSTMYRVSDLVDLDLLRDRIREAG